jgi:ribosomal protein L11 methyltransferase
VLILLKLSEAMDSTFIPKNFICADFSLNPLDPWRDLLVAELGELGFESFEEHTHGVKGYIEEAKFAQGSLDHVLGMAGAMVNKSYKTSIVQSENWNKNWEKQFQPLAVDDLCYVRAPFHEKNDAYELELIIHPQMSFGTGHHATTYLMIRQLFGLDLKDKEVLDMGSGTGILAVLAEIRGAKTIDAIDIDEWSFMNMPQNFELNGCKLIKHFQGGKELLVDQQYDVIIANINRNILLDQIQDYARVLVNNGHLLLSGFYEADIPMLLEAAQNVSFEMITTDQKDKWVMIHLCLRN